MKRVIATERPSGDAVFVHGDYQHFNVLWSRGRLSALVDWSATRIAPPDVDVDVSHCRLNLAVLFSVEVAERFRHAYESEAGRRVEPWCGRDRLAVTRRERGDHPLRSQAGRRDRWPPGD